MIDLPDRLKRYNNNDIDVELLETNDLLILILYHVEKMHPLGE